MNQLSNSELFDCYLNIYWVCNKTKIEIMRNPWSHPNVIPEHNEFEMAVAYEHMERLIPPEHVVAIQKLVYGY